MSEDILNKTRQVIEEITGLSYSNPPAIGGFGDFKKLLDLYESYYLVQEDSVAKDDKDFIIKFLSEAVEGEREISTEDFYILEKYLEKVNEFVVRKRRRKRRRPNSALSRAAKKRWNKNRSAYRRGLKKFHRSSRGKAFHKALGRFLKNSIETDVPILVESEGKNNKSILELFKVVTSGFTHFIIEFENDNKDKKFAKESLELIEDVKTIYNEILNELMECLKSDDPMVVTEAFNDALDIAIDVFSEFDIDVEY